MLEITLINELSEAQACEITALLQQNEEHERSERESRMTLEEDGLRKTIKAWEIPDALAEFVSVSAEHHVILAIPGFAPVSLTTYRDGPNHYSDSAWLPDGSVVAASHFFQVIAAAKEYAGPSTPVKPQPDELTQARIDAAYGALKAARQALYDAKRKRDEEIGAYQRTDGFSKEWQDRVTVCNHAISDAKLAYDLAADDVRHIRALLDLQALEK